MKTRILVVTLSLFVGILAMTFWDNTKQKQVVHEYLPASDSPASTAITSTHAHQ